ncbi:MAG: carboxypeptidase regulatory-like domain-containing protein [Pyrinomonadaceae bacterium]
MPSLRPASALAFASALIVVAACAAGARAQSSYQISQSLGVGLTPGTSQVSGFTCADASLPNEDCVAPIALPFPYTFYGQTFTAANVSTNGVLQFASASNDYGQNQVCFPLPQFNYAILPHWNDLQMNGAGEGVFTSVTGLPGSRVFNIEWRASYEFLPAGTLNFEVRLYENQQRFDIVYGNIGGSGASAPGGGITVPAVGAQQATDGQYTALSSACGLAAGGLRSGLALTFTGTGNPSRFIAGRVTDPDGNPLSGITVTLSGDASAQFTTGMDGRYKFPDLTGSNYSVAASQAGRYFYPGSRSFGAYPLAQFAGSQTINFVRTPPPAAGDVLITEFRFHGTGVPAAKGQPAYSVFTDEFVELYNNTNSTIVVNTPDGSSGWLLEAANHQSYIIPRGTVIPPRAHFLVAGTGYNTLFLYAPGEDFFSGDIADDSGIALFSSIGSPNLSTRIDAVGFDNATTPVDPLYREGAPLAPLAATEAQYTANTSEFSWVRKLAAGLPQDTNDNAADFQLVSTSGAPLGAVQPVIGAPAPENLYSPPTRNSQIKASYVDPGCVTTSTDPASACARVRDTTPVTGGSLGTLSIRRKWTNQAGAPVVRLRFRIVNLSTLGNRDVAEADLRVLSSSDVTVTGTNGAVNLKALTLEQMPRVTVTSGGLNTGVRAGSITLASPLAPGASINVEFRLGVEAEGNYRFAVNVEAQTSTPPAPAASGFKTGGGFTPGHPKVTASKAKP